MPATSIVLRLILLTPVLFHRLVMTQKYIDLYLPEECANDTEVADLSALFPSTSRESSVFRLLTPHPLFYINSDTAQLRTKKRVDREGICYHNNDCITKVSILYHLKRMKSKPTTIQAKIKILDINDNAPRWEMGEKPFRLEIPEHSLINSEFTIPEALDPDRAPENTTQIYYIRKSHEINKLFDIRIEKRSNLYNSVGSQIRLVLLSDLDREKQNQYTLSIVAKDGGKPALMGELSVNIIVTDINDHHPVFQSSSPVFIKVSEDKPVSSLIFTFHATDIDSSDADNLKFSFGHGTPIFVKESFWLKEQNGQMVLQQYLDYEKRKIYHFNIEVTDGKHKNSLAVTVKVLNVNDNAPKISIDAIEGRGSLAVPENQPPGQHIGIIVVRDADDPEENQTITCLVDSHILKIIPSYEGAKTTFLLVTTQTFDREAKSYHIFSVTCTDEGKPRQKSSVTTRLHITDVNDNKPVLVGDPLKARIEENFPTGQFFFQIKALDNDSAENADIHYYLESESENLFSVDHKTGKLYTKRSFDAEETRNIKIHISVSDRPNRTGHLVRGIIDLSIKDINDHPPHFSQDIYHFNVIENSKTGTSVGRVTAKDNDILSKNSRIRYKFKEDTDGLTKSHLSLTENGKLFVKSVDLDREKTPSFTFYVLAVDNGQPPLSTSAYIQIEVKDINDNPPEWIYPESQGMSVNITYRLPVGHQITRFEAKDPDLGPNGELEYFVAQIAFGSGIFQLQPTTGVLYLARTLVPQDIRLYHMVVGVRDHGRPSLSKLRTFKVNIVHQLEDGRGGRYALFGKFEGDLLIILILVIITLVICMGLISAIWFLKCGRQTGRWLNRRRFHRDSMRPPDGHSPSPSNEIMPVFLGHSHDSFISNLTKTTFCDRTKLSDSNKSGQRYSPSQSLYHSKNINTHYQCLRHLKDINSNQQPPKSPGGTSNPILTRHNSIGGTAIGDLELTVCGANGPDPEDSPDMDAAILVAAAAKANTLPVPNNKSTGGSNNSTTCAGSQLSVRWLDRQPHAQSDISTTNCSLDASGISNSNNNNNNANTINGNKHLDHPLHPETAQYQVCISTGSGSNNVCGVAGGGGGGGGGDNRSTTPKYPIIKLTASSSTSNTGQPRMNSQSPHSGHHNINNNSCSDPMNNGSVCDAFPTNSAHHHQHHIMCSLAASHVGTSTLAGQKPPESDYTPLAATTTSTFKSSRESSLPLSYV